MNPRGENRIKETHMKTKIEKVTIKAPTITLTLTSQTFFPVKLGNQAIKADGTRSGNGSDAFVATLHRRPVEGDTVSFQEQSSTRTITGKVTEVRGIVTGNIDFDVEIGN